MKNIVSKKTAIYIRVSTDAQREEGYSIEAQTEKLIGYCTAKDYKNHELYIDGGWSGSNIERPELQRLIREVKEGKIERVVVYKLDRLSRSQKDTLYLIEDVFNPFGVDFDSLMENMDTSTSMGRLMVGILSAFAQLERENIKERTSMGMQKRVEAGFWMGGGRIPYGYDYDKEQGILVPNEGAQKVRQIYDLYLKGYSTTKIAKLLCLKYDNWVMSILQRKSNAGYIVYNGVEYKGRHEPIVSLETYQQVMDMVTQRSVVRNTESQYLLQGLVYCGKCGAKMRYQKWGDRGTKLICYSTQKSRPHMVKDANCDQEKIWASDVEQVVINDIFNVTFAEEPEEKKSTLKESILDILNKQRADLNSRLKRLYNLYAGSEDETLLETIHEIRESIAAIDKQIGMEVERNALSSKALSVQKVLSTVKDTWKYMTEQEKKSLVKSCVEKIVITGEKVEIFYKFKEFAKGIE
jgi:site-specific DNA recombinase